MLSKIKNYEDWIGSCYAGDHPSGHPGFANYPQETATNIWPKLKIKYSF
jgi:hypothetical protein